MTYQGSTGPALEALDDSYLVMFDVPKDIARKQVIVSLVLWGVMCIWYLLIRARLHPSAVSLITVGTKIDRVIVRHEMTVTPCYIALTHEHTYTYIHEICTHEMISTQATLLIPNPKT